MFIPGCGRMTAVGTSNDLVLFQFDKVFLIVMVRHDSLLGFSAPQIATSDLRSRWRARSFSLYP